jgi:transposase
MAMTTLTMQDEKRQEVIQRVFREELTVREAATILGISERQCYRIKGRVKEYGAKGVTHGKQGRPCSNVDNRRQNSTEKNKLPCPRLVSTPKSNTNARTHGT